MRQFNIFKGTKGFLLLRDRMLRFRYMITKEATTRVHILAFWEKYGTEATTEAFKVSRATLFRWQKKLGDGHGKIESLNKTSTVPKRKRKRVVGEAVKTFILTERQFDYRLSKDKLAVLMKEDGIADLSASTVGRILGDLKKQGVLPHRKKLSLMGKTGKFVERNPIKRKKLRSKDHEGGLVKADSIVRFVNGTKRYIVTAIDKETKFAFAYAYTAHSSSTTADFMGMLTKVLPIPLTHLQTDNGSEFAHHFDIYLEKANIVHFHTYPRSPKMNAEIERFNRTLSDAFISRNRMLLAYDLDEFNKRLIDWLLWYNTRRPHWSLGLVSPLRYICNKLPEESHMWWTDTKTVFSNH